MRALYFYPYLLYIYVCMCVCMYIIYKIYSRAHTFTHTHTEDTRIQAQHKRTHTTHQVLFPFHHCTCMICTTHARPWVLSIMHCRGLILFSVCTGTPQRRHAHIQAAIFAHTYTCIHTSVPGMLCLHTYTCIYTRMRTYTCVKALSWPAMSRR